ncbi:ArsR/SmtB family transcription factor [Dongia deserti]|uniref:ArsR/SmtB family transcription factor n=1 Tax=Dongia deserti TaxID=2268030 RepID=UPI000E65EAFD|nr:winged helix-turn-helix domain-containing protein [Dongia deserti]
MTKLESGEAGLESFAKIIGDATRIRMLQLLMEGRALTAKELAYGARVEPATATQHLRRLQEGGLVSMKAQGRHKYFKLASAQVAELMELLMVLAPARNGRSVEPRIEEPLRRGRMCYDHLAGELGIGITEALVKQGVLRQETDAFVLTRRGGAWFAALGIDVEAARALRRKFATSCLDWSERRDHLGGALGAALAERLVDLGWIARKRNSRAVTVTEAGWRKLAEHFPNAFDA